MGVAARPANADYSLTQQARRVESVLDTMRLQRIVLLAQGTSATVAYHVAADQPSRVQSIVSLAGGAIDRQGTHGVKLALALAPLLDTPLGRALGRRKFLASVREQSANAEWCTKDVMREYLSPYETDLRRSLRALGRMADAREPVPIAARLPLVRTPVHLLLGAKQSANAPSATEVEQLRRLLPSLTVDTIERAGTMLHEERADAVVAAVIKSVRLVNP
jgi:pimeloyl-ACP methyl ester carboxylesterase